MKKSIPFIFIFALIASLLFAGGDTEDVWDNTLTLAAEGDKQLWPDGPMLFADIIVPDFETETGIKINMVRVGSPNDTTERLDAMIRADLIPNVYWDYGGRAGIYATSGLALPLNKYLDQEVIENFYPSYIEMFSRNGNVYGLPCTSWATAGLVNISLIKKAGAMDVLADDVLTYDELEDITRILQKSDNEYMASGLFAAETGGDYYIYTFWLAGHGAKLYNDDGTVALNSPEGLEALTLMKRWYDEGLLPFGAAGLKDVDYSAQWYPGNKTIARVCTPTPASQWPFKSLVMTPVKKTTVEFSPAASGIQVGVAFNTGNEAENAAAAELVAFIARAKYQQLRVEMGRFPSRFDVDLSAVYPEQRIAIELMAENGVFNMGLGTPHYVAMRMLWQTMLQSILTDDTVEWAKDMNKSSDGSISGALAVFEERGNEIIDSMAR